MREEIDNFLSKKTCKCSNLNYRCKEFNSSKIKLNCKYRVYQVKFFLSFLFCLSKLLE